MALTTLLYVGRAVLKVHHPKYNGAALGVVASPEVDRSNFYSQLPPDHVHYNLNCLVRLLLVFDREEPV
jgi:hypothetical protein